jgi:hypothetical protein
MFGLTITVHDHGVADQIEKETDKMIGEFLRVVINVYQKMFEGSRSGRIVQQGRFDRRSRIGGVRPQGKGQRIHRPSRPGEPLARDTGKTQRSYSVQRLKSGVYRIRFGGGVRYWEIRDDGKARPTILPALEKAAEIYFG